MPFPIAEIGLNTFTKETWIVWNAVSCNKTIYRVAQKKKPSLLPPSLSDVFFFSGLPCIPCDEINFILWIQIAMCLTHYSRNAGLADTNIDVFFLWMLLGVVSVTKVANSRSKQL